MRRCSRPRSGSPRTCARWASGPCWRRSRPAICWPPLPEHPPAEGEPLDAIMADVDRLILPGITHWNHPSFFAYFGITGSGPGIVGELICAALNVNAMLWRTSPAATELEERTLAWVGELIGPAGLVVRRRSPTRRRARRCTALAAAREAAGLDIRSARDGRPRRPAAAAGVHLGRGALVGREGLHRARDRPAGPAQDRDRRRASGCAPMRWRRRSRRTSPRACGRSPSCRRSARPRTTSVDPVADDRRHRGPPRHLAACRRGVRRRRGAAAERTRPLLGGLRARRLAGVQPSQVAVHAGRLQPALHVAPGGAATRRSRWCRST